MSSLITEVAVVGGLGLLAWYMLKDSAIGRVAEQVADTTERVVSAAATSANQALDFVGVLQQYSPSTLIPNAIRDVQRSTNVGAGTLPQCRTEQVFDKGWDGLNWRGLGGGQTSCGCGDRDNVDGLCYNRCPSGTNRVSGMPYLCR